MANSSNNGPDLPAYTISGKHDLWITVKKMTPFLRTHAYGVSVIIGRTEE